MSLLPALSLPSLLANSPLTPGSAASQTAQQTDPNAMTPSFGQTLSNALGQVNDLQLRSGEMTRAFATGQTSDVHSVMIAAEQATIAVQMATQVRNKCVDAYTEIMHTSM